MSVIGDIAARFISWRSLAEFRRATRIVIGASGTSYPGWLSTDRDSLDISRRESFASYWRPGSRSIFLAEHVWEHLSPDQAKIANRNCFEFLRPGGRLRIAVPDGLHPDPSYIDYVRPGGSGSGSDDHKILYDFKILGRQLQEAGFEIELLEYWDDEREFHFQDWSSADGHIVRSKRYDPRNQNGVLAYTSLIVDAIKPRVR